MTNEPTYGVPPADIARRMSGLEFLQAICDGRLPQAPIAERLDFLLTEAAEGLAVFVGTPKVEHYNPIGGAHGGWYGTLLDSCMACAVQTTLPQGTSYTTVEYSVNLVRGITVETGPVRAEGRILHRGRRMATAEGRMLDGNNRLLAHGTTTCMILEATQAT